MTQRKLLGLSIFAFLIGCGDRSQDDLPSPVQPMPDAGSTVDATDDIVEAAETAPNTDLQAMCADVEAQTAAVAFQAPEPRGEGHLAFTAKIEYPDMANKVDVVPGLNPFPGCVAPFAKDQSLICNFGAAFQGTVVMFNVGLSDGSLTEPAGHFFSQTDGATTVTLGTVGACLGQKLVGSCQEGKCTGALSQDAATGNLVYKFPQS